MAQFIVNITDPAFDKMESDDARQFIVSSVVPEIMSTFEMAKSVTPPEELPRGGEIGCTASTAGGGSVSCSGSIRW